LPYGRLAENYLSLNAGGWAADMAGRAGISYRQALVPDDWLAPRDRRAKADSPDHP